MVEEMDALHFSDTWDLAILLVGKTLVGCRWVYIVKIGPDGRVDHLKTLQKGTIRSMVPTTMIHFPMSLRLSLFVFSYLWLLCNLDLCISSTSKMPS